MSNVTKKIEKESRESSRIEQSNKNPLSVLLTGEQSSKEHKQGSKSGK
jgi:hypothetical protein